MDGSTAKDNSSLGDIEKAPSNHAGDRHLHSESGSTSKPDDTHINLNPANPPEIEKVIVLSFRNLQLQRIAELQDQLLLLNMAAARQGGAPPDGHSDMVDKALESYARALRNYETLSLNALSKPPPGATLVGSILSTEAIIEQPKHYLARQLLRLGNWIEGIRLVNDISDLAGPGYGALLWAGVKLLVSFNDRFIGLAPSQVIEIIERHVGNLGFRELDPLGRENRFRKSAFTERIAMAMFGGVSLIIPMLIMTLRPSENVSLITTSLATFVFAIMLALGASNSAGKDVLAATAAYAAVLVVFVGTNSAGPG